MGSKREFGKLLQGAQSAEIPRGCADVEYSSSHIPPDFRQDAAFETYRHIINHRAVHVQYAYY